MQNTVDDIIVQETEKENLSVKDETFKKIDDEVDEDEIYNLDKFSLDENKLRKPEFKSELINIYMI